MAIYPQGKKLKGIRGENGATEEEKRIRSNTREQRKIIQALGTAKEDQRERKEEKETGTVEKK